jgi:hypothetical protein
MTHHLSDSASDLPSNTTTQAGHVVLTHDEDHARADPALRGHHAPALLLQTRQGQDQSTLHGTSVQGGADVRRGIDHHPRESRLVPFSLSKTYTKPNPPELHGRGDGVRSSSVFDHYIGFEDGLWNVCDNVLAIRSKKCRSLRRSIHPSLPPLTSCECPCRPRPARTQRACSSMCLGAKRKRRGS